MDLRINREDSVTESLSHDIEKFGLFTGYVYAINSVIGAGFLGIPWAYENSGWLFSFSFQILVSFQSYIQAMQLLESMSRSEVLLRIIEEGGTVRQLTLKDLLTQPAKENLMQPRTTSPVITHRVITITDIVKIVAGPKAGMLHLILLFVYQTGVLTAYASIFSTSFASNVPLGTWGTCDLYSTSGFFTTCRAKYWVYLTIFAVVTIYMTVKGIHEQKRMQQAMSVLRFVVIFIIIITCLYNIFNHSNNEDDGYNSAELPPLIRPAYIGHAIPIILFASQYHSLIPCISEAVKDKSRNLPRIQMFTIITCAVCYSILGIVVSIAIDDLPSMTSLSYRNYSAGHSQKNRPAWTYIIEYLVVISPALDVLSSYPVQALNISGSIINWKFSEVALEEREKIEYLCRFLTSFFPIFISFFVFDLGSILDWVGLIGILVMLVPIPLLHLATRQLVNGSSSYDTFGNRYLNIFMSLTSFALLLGVIALNIIED